MYRNKGVEELCDLMIFSARYNQEKYSIISQKGLQRDKGTNW